MGFGKKTDFSTGKTLDLDKTYKNIIRPAAESAGFLCVRADEIQGSGLIDKSMYALLIDAELVVADISTYNPNAIYELGIRHAVRPHATIIIKEKEGKIPFDIDHTRIFIYSHLGEDIGADEAERCKGNLTRLIKEVDKNNVIDSPLYDYIQGIKPIKLNKNERQRIIGDLANRENCLFAVVEEAEHKMMNSEFSTAAKLWEKARNLAPTETYYIQQNVLAIYKAKEPSEIVALTNALNIITELDPENSNDPETLGLTGAIYKRMWLITKDVEFLKLAVKFYKKGFQIRSNAYTGENYALCLDEMSNVEIAPDEKTYFTIEAKKTRQIIIESIMCMPNMESGAACIEDMWLFATMANCYYGLGNLKDGDKYEKKFLSLATNWQVETYQLSKARLTALILNNK